MARNSSGFVSLINNKGLDTRTAAFVKLMYQTLAPSGEPAAGEQPEQRLSKPLSEYKEDALSIIQQDLEALSSALKLWLAEPSQAATATTAATVAKKAPESTENQNGQQAQGRFERDSSTSTSISAFLQTVGEAVITAQGELDKSLAAPENANASAAYRIPKLSAEIAFEVEKVNEEGVSILLASRSSSERESLRQKVCFDIVATPLPAELSARNQLAAIIFNRLPEGNPWRKRLTGATLVRQARGTLALSLEGGPAVLVIPDEGALVQGPLKLDDALAKALESIAAKA